MTRPDLPLSFLHRPAAPGTAQPWLLVLLHGVGSNEQDLFGRPVVAQALQVAGAQLGVPPERVVVGGFSQGGIM